MKVLALTAACTMLCGCALIEKTNNLDKCHAVSTVQMLRNSPQENVGKTLCVQGYVGGDFEFAGLYDDKKSALNVELDDVVEMPGMGWQISSGAINVGEFVILKGIISYPADCWASPVDGVVTECSPVKRPVYLGDVEIISTRHRP